MTNHSETIAKLAEALAKAQGAMRPANRDHENPFFHSKYADLTSIWESIRKPLSENGLAITQSITETQAAFLTVETLLLHASGEFITSLMTVPTGKGDIQALGSAISYARRYALSALIGAVSDEDDDGQAASKTGQKPAPVPHLAPKPVNPIDAATEIPYSGSPEQLAADIKAAEKARGWSERVAPATAQPVKPNPRNLRLAELMRLGAEWYGENGLVFAMKNHIKKVYDHDSSAELTNAQIEEQIIEFGRRIDARRAEREMQPALAPFDEFSSGADEHGKGVD